MRNVVCTIAKNENLYINEWCHYYLNLGFDTLYIYDNNDKDAPFIGTFIDKDIRKNVVIISKRGVKTSRLIHKTFQEFYDSYNKTFGWCLFCDCDEFLVGIDNIKDFLAQDKFKDYDMIRVKWNVFGDDGILEREPVFGAFKTVLTDLSFSNSSKSIIRGGLSPLNFSSSHLAYKAISKDKDGNRIYTRFKSCLPSGLDATKCDRLITVDYSNETVFLNHYITKSLSEFLRQKFGRGDVVFKEDPITLDYYWSVNKKTPERVQWLKEHGYITNESN